MTRDEFESLLEEAYLSGYNDAELDISNESNNVKKKIDEYKDTSLAGKERGIDGFTMYDPKKIKTQNKKWLNDADPHHTNQTMDGSNDFYFVRRNKGTNGKSSTPRGRIKVGNDDDLEYRMKRKLKGNALKDDIKELKSLREDFESLLEEAFLAGYEDATKEIFNEESGHDRTHTLKNIDKALPKMWKTGYKGETKDEKYRDHLIRQGKTSDQVSTKGKQALQRLNKISGDKAFFRQNKKILEKHRKYNSGELKDLKSRIIYNRYNPRKRDI